MSASQQLAAFNYSVPGPLVWNPVRSTSFNAIAGNAYPVNTTSGAVTVTLPANPFVGQVVQITDYAGTFATNVCTVNPNGGKINSATSNAVLAFNRESVAIVYLDSTQGWVAYSGFLNSPIASYTASYLAVSGGGGTGNLSGGGGGGGLLSGTSPLILGVTYTVTVGAGGAGVAGSAGAATNNGTNSSIVGAGLTIANPNGGGGGGPYGTIGNSGGSGGGGGGNTSGSAGSGGSATSGQGNAGGAGAVNGYASGGGGGGAGAVGSAASGTTGGAGGNGTASSITGSSVTYAGGGGGSGQVGAAGGTGGGGAGGTQTVGIAGTANTGGGAGASWNTSGVAGGSGIVILSIPTVNYTGTTTGSPTITTSGSNTIIKFTASGSYTA